MKVVIDCRTLQDSSKNRGIGQYTHNLLLNLKNRDKFMVYSDNQYDYEKFKNIYDLEHVNFGAKALRFNHSKRLAAFLKSKGASLFHFTCQYNLFTTFPIPYTATVHDLLFFVFWKYNYRTKFDYNFHLKQLRRQFENSKAVIAVSESTKKDIIKYLNYSQDSIKVIYNGMPGTFVKPIINKDILKKLNLKKPYFLYIGSLDKRKNIDNMLQAFLNFNKNKEYVFVICHGDNPGPTLLQRRIYAGREDEVKFVSYIFDDEMASLYANAAVFMFTTLYEGFGYPVIEALSQEVPVLTSNISSLPEVGQDAVVYADPYSVDSMVLGIRQIIENKEETEKLKKRGLEVVKKFSYKTFAEETENMLLSIGERYA